MRRRAKYYELVREVLGTSSASKFARKRFDEGRTMPARNPREPLGRRRSSEGDETQAAAA